MAEKTKISWADATSNFWWGCTEVGPECDHCYARELAKRFKQMSWGKGAPRVQIKAAKKNLLAWDKKARTEKRMLKVFTQSMSDVFDVEVDEAWREEMFDAIRETTNCYFLVLTKRPGRARHYDYPHEKVWLGTSIGVNRNLVMVEKLVDAPALVHWVSFEPALEQIAIKEMPKEIQWVVCGGESGSQARRFDLEIGFESLRQCREREIRFFMKQLGAKPFLNGKPFPMSDKKGEVLSDWPEELRVQEYPL